uniref:Zinc finger protein n=1 Tax=Trichobilharzia regenti TaxID=157069 RepID=A0AA85JX25_TRIRE|nr:unnamed protein product [Trichobilharzia regenti]
MPELNMFTVRPADGSSSLVTRGLEDILPSTPQQSILTPPTEDEWDSDIIGCDESEQNTSNVASLASQHEASVSDSFSHPLFIDVPSRTSIDEGPSYEPMTTFSGLPSNSTASFSLSPILGSSDVVDVSIPKPSVEHFASSQKTFTDDNPFSNPSSTFGTSLPSHGFVDSPFFTCSSAQRMSPTKNDVYFHKSWDAFSSQPELSTKERMRAHSGGLNLENQSINPSYPTNVPNRASVDQIVDTVIRWIESVSFNTMSDSGAWDKIDVNELKEAMKTLLTPSNMHECDRSRSCSVDSCKPEISPSLLEQSHFPVMGKSSEGNIPLPSGNISVSPRQIPGIINKECVSPNLHIQPTEFQVCDPQQHERSQYYIMKHASKCPRYTSKFSEQSAKEKLPPTGVCGCKSSQEETANTNLSHVNPFCKDSPVVSSSIVYPLDPRSDSCYVLTGADASTNPLAYAQKILPSLINERGSLSFQLLSSILAHSRNESNQDGQRSMLLDGLKQALSSILLSSTNVPSATSTNVVCYGTDPVYSKTHSQILCEDKLQSTTGYVTPVRRHLSCVGSTDNLSPGSVVDSPTHNICLDSQNETRSRYSHPSESDSCFSESCISPSHISIEHHKETRMVSSSYPGGGGADMLHRAFLPSRGQEYRSGDFPFLGISPTSEQGQTLSHESAMRTDMEASRTSKCYTTCSGSLPSQPRKLDYKDSTVPLRIGLPSLTTSGRIDVRKCRKVYGIENRDQWCNQCKWKKACRRFPNPCLTSTKHPHGSSTNRNVVLPTEKSGSRQSFDSSMSEICVTCSSIYPSDMNIPTMAAATSSCSSSSCSWPISSSSVAKTLSNSLTDPFNNQTRQ